MTHLLVLVRTIIIGDTDIIENNLSIFLSVIRRTAKRHVRIFLFASVISWRVEGRRNEMKGGYSKMLKYFEISDKE